jgi:hypothetical protein
LSSNNEGRSAAPSARSDGLDDVDGGPDGGVYSETTAQRQGGVWVPRLALSCAGNATRDEAAFGCSAKLENNFAAAVRVVRRKCYFSIGYCQRAERQPN